MKLKREFNWDGIGKIFQSYRNMRGLSQLQVSTAVDMTRASIANLERGKQKFPIEKLQAVAEELDLNVEIFITEGSAVNGYCLLQQGSPVIIGDTQEEVIREAVRQGLGKNREDLIRNGFAISNIMWGVPNEEKSLAQAS